MVCFASLWRCFTQDAAAVASHQGVPLGWCGGADATSVPEDLAVAGEDGADEVGEAPEAFELRGG